MMFSSGETIESVIHYGVIVLLGSLAVKLKGKPKA